MEKGERSVERKRKEGSQDSPKCASKVRDDDEQELEKWVNLQDSRRSSSSCLYTCICC